MAVSNRTIITKMIDELEKAKTHHDHVTTMKKHIENVKLLCELLLEADQPENKRIETTDLSAQELKVMLGDSHTNKAQQGKLDTQKSKPDFYDEGNGDSIFDF